MRTPKDTSDPAFPLQDAAAWQYGGMSLRDYFAGQALAGRDHPGVVYKDGEAYKATAQDVAEWCYALADAMLAEREKAK